MATLLRALLLCAASPLAHALPANALALPERPAAHVNDYARVLSAGAQHGLEERFTAFERRTGHQVAVAIFPTTEGTPIEEVATRLFEKWRLGAAKENDGILLVLGMREHDVRIEVGYGLEPRLPDALAGRIIRENMIPFLRQGETGTAILSFEKRLEDILIAGNKGRPTQRRTGWALPPSLTILFLMLFFVGPLIRFLLIQAGYRSRTIGSRGAWNGGWWIGGGGWGGGGGWSGGGGGLSGGGGASGRW